MDVTVDKMIIALVYQVSVCYVTLHSSLACCVWLVFNSAVMNDLVVSAECTLLEPVSLQVSVARNLSASWYHGCPDIELSGRLHSLSVIRYSYFGTNSQLNATANSAV